MKTLIIALFASLAMMLGGKEQRVLTLTPTPQMHCNSCEQKIKGNLRFEKGVQAIETSIADQTVVITYQADKTNVATLQAAMKKIGYDTEVKSDLSAADAKKAKAAKDGKAQSKDSKAKADKAKKAERKQ